MERLNMVITDLRATRAQAFPKKGELPAGWEGMDEKARTEAQEEAKTVFNQQVPMAVEALVELSQDLTPGSGYNRNQLIEGIAWKFGNRLNWNEAELAKHRRHVAECDARIEQVIESGQAPDSALIADFESALTDARKYQGYRDNALAIYQSAKALYEAVTAREFSDPKPRATAKPVTKKELDALRKAAKELS